MTDHKVRQRAYEIWEREGRLDGREAEHWAQAQAELAQTDAASGAESAAKPKKTAAKGAPKADASKTDTPKATPAAKAVAPKTAKPAAAAPAKAVAAKKPRGETSRGSLH